MGGCILTGVIGRRMISNRHQSTMPANMQKFARGLSVKLAHPAHSSSSLTPTALSRQTSRLADAQPDATSHQNSSGAAPQGKTMSRPLARQITAGGSKPRRSSLLFRQPSRAAAAPAGDLQSVARYALLRVEARTAWQGIRQILGVW